MEYEIKVFYTINHKLKITRIKVTASDIISGNVKNMIQGKLLYFKFWE